MDLFGYRNWESCSCHKDEHNIICWSLCFWGKSCRWVLVQIFFYFPNGRFFKMLDVTQFAVMSYQGDNIWVFSMNYPGMCYNKKLKPQIFYMIYYIYQGNFYIVCELLLVGMILLNSKLNMVSKLVNCSFGCSLLLYIWR